MVVNLFFKDILPLNIVCARALTVQGHPAIEYRLRQSIDWSGRQT